MGAHLRPPPPVPGLPAFDAVIARALAKEPAARFESGGALGAAAVAAAGVRRRSARCGAAQRARDPRRRARLRRRAAAAARARGAGARCLARAAAARGAGRHAAGAVERRLAEVRAGNDPGQGTAGRGARAAARRARRMQAALADFDAEVERILVELETARGRVLADADPRPRRLAALQDELETLADAARPSLVGNPPPWVASRRRRGGPTIRPMTMLNRMRRTGRRRYIESYEFSPALHRKLRRRARRHARGRRRARRPARLVPRLPVRRRRPDRHAVAGRRRRLARDDPDDARVHRVLRARVRPLPAPQPGLDAGDADARPARATRSRSSTTTSCR